MDSFELNKIIGAVLGTLLFVMGVGFLAEAIYHPIEDRGPGYDLPEPEGTETAEAPAGPTVEPIAVRLAAANAEAGAAAVRKCQSCHNFGEGEGHKTGPALWGTVGNPIGGHEGYSYSAALQERNAAGETWNYENLDEWLAGPTTFAPGTKMTLSVSSPEERADILAYLQTLSSEPVPFPAPEDGPAPEGAEATVPEGEDVTAPAEAPATEDVTRTPTETQTEIDVEGTPTGNNPAEGGEAATPAEGEGTAPDETAPQSN